MFTFDVDAETPNGTTTVAKPAKAANPTTETSQISDISNISSAPPLLSNSQRTELRALVNQVADRHAFTRAQRAEALQIALGDPIAAIECFRELVKQP